MSRIYQGGSAESRYRQTDLSQGYRPQRAKSNEKATREWRESIIQNGQTKLRDLQRDIDAQNLQSQLARGVEKAGLKVQQDRASAELEMQQRYDTDRLKQEHSYQQALMDQESLLQRSEAQVANANLSALRTTVNGLISFAGAGLDFIAEQEKIKEQKAKEAAAINAAFPVLDDPNAGANNVDATQQGIATSQADIATEDAIQNATDDPSTQNSLRQESTAPQIAQDQQRRSNVYEALNDFSGFYSGWVNDPSITYKRADGSTFTAATARDRADLLQIDAAARNAFAKAVGLADLPRAQVASVLAPAVLNTSNSWVTTNNSKLIEANQAEALNAAIVDVEAGLAAGDNLNETFSRGVAAVFGSGAAGRDKGKANEAVLDAMLDWAIDNGRADVIDKLAGVHKRYNPDGTPVKGTKLGRQYRDKFHNARKDVVDREIEDSNRIERANKIRVRDLENDRDIALANASSPEEETKINVQFEQALIQNGSPLAMDRLRDHRVNGNNYSEWNHIELKERIDNGEVITNEEFRQQVSERRITMEEAKTLGYDPASDMSRGEAALDAAEEFSSEAKSIAEGLLVEAGGATAKNNPDKFRLDMDTTGKSIVNDAAEAMVDQLTRWIQRNPGATNTEMREQLHRIKDNVGLSAVKYDVNTGFGGYTFGVNGRGATTTAQDFVIRRQGPNGVYTVVSGQSPAQLRDRANEIAISRDQILTVDEMRLGVSAVLSGGAIPKIIRDKAEALGTTADVLIENQAKAYGYDGSASVPDVPQGVGAIRGEGPQDLRQGKRYLQSHLGVPHKGAAYLAANIQQESGWNGRRSWGAVYNPTTGQYDGTSRNGGLVSWASWSDNPARLGKIESYLGKDISQATHAEQLSAMMWEMKTYYPDQYRIFMNPNSTDRQLRRASYGYWGYGHEGVNRFGSYLNTALAVS